MEYTLHHGDLPDGLDLGAVVAVDGEMMGLNAWRDRLCMLQFCGEHGDIHLVKFGRGEYHAPNIVKLFADDKVVKILHCAVTDMAFAYRWLGVRMENVFCTKVASRIARTNTDMHSMKYLIKEYLDIEFKKTHQTSDWGAETYSPEQLDYAASDVLHLHALREKLMELLLREGRAELAEACFKFLPYRAVLDLNGWPEEGLLGY